MTTGKDESIGLTATCSADSITLHLDKPGSYRIWRKRPEATRWQTPMWARPLGSEFVDQNGIVPGQACEYNILEMMTGAQGYILAGSKIPLVDNRGKLVLIVERTHAAALAGELAWFIQDLVSEGWEVIRRDVSKTLSPESVKALIKAHYDSDPANVRTVILFGAVPVRMSGPINYDGHGSVMVAADGFYGDMSGDWSGSPSIYKSDLSISVGRIDFSEMTNFKNKSPARSELDLLRSYLNRNHAFRTGQTRFQNRAVIADNFQDRPFSGVAWRMFPTCVPKIDEVASGLVGHLASNDYLMAYACGGGSHISCVGFGDSDELSLKNIRCPFVFLLGSYFGNWATESGLMKSALASGALAVRLGGNPNFFGHRMGLGGTIGESHLLSANNGTVYATGNVEEGIYSPVSGSGRGVHQALIGDPTLTFVPVAPVTNFDGLIIPGQWLHLTWTPNHDAEGSHVYRSGDPNGPFTRLSSELVVGNIFTVADHFKGLTYMVRAVKLVETPSGSYYAASCGVMWSDSQTPPMPPDPTKPMSKVKFVSLNMLNQGQWIETYGQDGGLIASGPKRVPLYASVVVEAPQYAWSTDTSDLRALQIWTQALRIAAAWNHEIGFTVEIKSDALPHRLALYFLDWDMSGRRQRVEILDGATGAALDSREISSFGQGVYLVYDFQGSVTVRLTKLAGPNAVCSGIFFSPVGATRTLEILSGPSATGPWTSRGTVEVDARGSMEFYRLGIL